MAMTDNQESNGGVEEKHNCKNLRVAAFSNVLGIFAPGVDATEAGEALNGGDGDPKRVHFRDFPDHPTLAASWWLTIDDC